MATEIERKFLVNNDDWRAAADDGVAYRQGYLCGDEQSSVRVRVDPKGARLNIKSATLGIQRQEYEYPIPLEDANPMLDGLCRGPIIEKVRYHVRVGTLVWEVDEFSGENAGLVVAEVELEAADQAVEMPSWAGEEVSDDPRYYNVSLVQHPYKDW